MNVVEQRVENFLLFTGQDEIIAFFKEGNEIKLVLVGGVLRTDTGARGEEVRGVIPGRRRRSLQ